MFTTGVLCTVCGARVYFLIWKMAKPFRGRSLVNFLFVYFVFLLEKCIYLFILLNYFATFYTLPFKKVRKKDKNKNKWLQKWTFGFT